MAIPFATAEVVTAAEMNELARAHWRKTTAKQVVNTVVETDLLNGEITIDAGAMSTNRMLRLTALGDAVNNSGATQASPTFKLKLGATTLIVAPGALAAWSFSSSRLGWRIVAEIANLGATNSQWATFDLGFSAVTAAAGANSFTTGEGLTTGFGANVDMIRAVGGGAGAVDTTAAQSLVLTVTNPAANALLDVTLKYAVVELV